MKDADFLLNWTEELKLEINSLEFPENDIRRDFFGLLYSATYSYYTGYISYELSSLINEGQVVFSENISEFKIHIDRLAEVSKEPILRRGYLNSLNRNLNIDCWSIFELCTTTFCFALSEEVELQNLLGHQCNEIFKLLKHSHVREVDAEKLKKQLVKEHLTHVPIVRKTDYLFKKAQHYYRDAKKDKDFLMFFGKLRNTLHTNYIYYGKDYEYRFGDAHFKFKNKNLVKWIDPFEPSPKLYFYLINELKAIWKTLIVSIDYKKTVFYPDLEQE